MSVFSYAIHFCFLTMQSKCLRLGMWVQSHFHAGHITLRRTRWMSEKVAFKMNLVGFISRFINTITFNTHTRGVRLTFSLELGFLKEPRGLWSSVFIEFTGIWASSSLQCLWKSQSRTLIQKLSEAWESRGAWTDQTASVVCSTVFVRCQHIDLTTDGYFALSQQLHSRD